MARNPRYTDKDGTRKAPFQYSEQYQQWRAAILRNDKAAINRAADAHNRKFGLYHQVED